MDDCVFHKGEAAGEVPPSPPPPQKMNSALTTSRGYVGYLFPYKLAQCQTNPTLLYDTAGREERKSLLTLIDACS